jgi:hypothetical protein
VPWEGTPLPTEWFVTDEVIESQKVGVGEDLFVVGLFSHHVGANRNLPIVRTGTIASMPLEPFIDQDSGEEFDAYLAEVRSIGGLSGSPVLIAINPITRLHLMGKAKEEPQAPGWTFYVLGLIRSHWEQPVEGAFRPDEVDNVNTGIATVTPITEVLPLLERDEFVNQRKEIDKIFAGERGEEVKDLSPERSEAPTQSSRASRT